jgi:predicted lipoprotein with Yx(FWY)xxD motif
MARRVVAGRIAAGVLAVGGLTGAALVPATAGAASSRTVKGLVISTARNATLGTILVSGTTVYTLQSNGAPCAAQCLKYWPEVLLPKGATKATAGSGVDAAKLGTIKRAGGKLQVTYAGRPLYWFIKDKAPGQVNGDVTDTWGTWSVVVTVKPKSGGGGVTTTTSPGGGGVGF